MSSIDTVLRYLAPSDANHDFGNDKPTTAQEMMAYNKALHNTPNVTIDYVDEGQCLANIVKNIPNYEPLAVANPDRDFCLRSRHLIETTNGNNYTVYYADVKYTSEMKKKYNKESFADDVIKFNQIKNELRQKSNAIKQSNKEAKKRGFIADLKNMINRVIDTSDEPFDNREEIDAPMFYTMMGLNVN